MKICKKCNSTFPSWEMVDGKKKVYTSRKFCFVCSPIGLHNTRNLMVGNQSNIFSCVCESCNLSFNAQEKQRRKCPSCYFKVKKLEKIEKIKAIVGNSCWICGYNRSWRNLAFHHVNPSEKVFSLTSRELVGHNWSMVLQEIQKCILVCHNCHGEIHEGLIDDKCIFVGEWQERFKLI